MRLIEEMAEKLTSISDDDLMIIEDDEDTKKIKMSILREYMAIRMDNKLETVKDSIKKDTDSTISPLIKRIVALENAYYNLARNYEYLNSTNKELKEKLHELITSTSQVMVGVPRIINVTRKDNIITLNRTLATKATVYNIYIAEKNEDDIISNKLIKTIEYSSVLSKSIDLSDNAYSIPINLLICGFINTIDGIKNGALSRTFIID